MTHGGACGRKLLRVCDGRRGLAAERGGTAVYEGEERDLVPSDGLQRGPTESEGRERHRTVRDLPRNRQEHTHEGVYTYWNTRPKVGTPTETHTRRCVHCIVVIIIIIIIL